MTQATTALSLTLPVVTCFPVRFYFLTESPSLTPGKSPLTREIMRVPSMSAPRCVGADVLARDAKMPGPLTAYSFSRSQ